MFVYPVFRCFVYSVPGPRVWLRVAAMMTAPSWDQLQRQDRLNQTFRHAHSLELQTKVCYHGEGPYSLLGPPPG